jgi:hypothetical protein
LDICFSDSFIFFFLLSANKRHSQNEKMEDLIAELLDVHDDAINVVTRDALIERLRAGEFNPFTTRSDITTSCGVTRWDLCAALEHAGFGDLAQSVATTKTYDAIFAMPPSMRTLTAARSSSEGTSLSSVAESAAATTASSAAASTSDTRIAPTHKALLSAYPEVFFNGEFEKLLEQTGLYEDDGDDDDDDDGDEPAPAPRPPADTLFQFHD